MIDFKAFRLALCILVPLTLTAQEVIQFPDGCGNPFAPDGIFGDFYEKTIQSSVIDAGAVNSTHVNLFSINRIRKYMAAKYPNPEDGEAVDQLIRAQLCNYSKDKQGLSTSSLELHRYLASIADRLLGDVKKVVSELNVKERERQKTIEKYELRFGLIEKAESLAEKEVQNYLR